VGVDLVPECLKLRLHGEPLGFLCTAALLLDLLLLRDVLADALDPRDASLAVSVRPDVEGADAPGPVLAAVGDLEVLYRAVLLQRFKENGPSFL